MDNKRIRQLAGLTEAHDGSLDQIIVVTNPRTGEDELGDIMFEATPAELYFIAKGTMENPNELNIKFYAPEQKEAARRDAEMRMSGAQQTQRQ